MGNVCSDPISHSASDDQLNTSRRQSATEAIEQISIDDLLRSPRGPRAAHLPREASGQPSNLLPPQDPRLSRGNHSSKRKRQGKQKESTVEQAPSSNKCRRCDHDMAKCRHCKSVNSCHKCGDVPRSGIQVGASSAMPAQALPDASSAIINLNESYLNPEALANFVTPQNMPTQLPPYYNPNEVMHFFDPQSFDDMTNTFTDDTFPNDPFIRVAMDVVSHPPLRDLSDKIQESPVFESDTKLLRSIGLGTLVGPLQGSGSRTIHRSQKQWISIHSRSSPPGIPLPMPMCNRPNCRLRSPRKHPVIARRTRRDGIQDDAGT
jgi:hypothetical protein